MDVPGLLGPSALGSALAPALVSSMLPSLARAHAPVLAAAAAVTVALALAGGVLYRRHRQRARHHGATAERDRARELKERLRRRLVEPIEAFATPENPGPTIGASKAVEADLDAVAKTVLPDTGWRCGAAKQLLRKAINGHAGNGAANGASNGAEAVHWRQLGALALLDDPSDALRAYSRAADLAPDDADLQILLAALYLRTGRVDVAEALLRKQMERVAAADDGGPVRYRTGAMLGDVLLAKGARDEALTAYEASRKELEALLEREPESARWRRDASLTHDRIGDLKLANGQLDLALESFRRSLEIAEALAKADRERPALQHDLSVAHDRIGEALEAKGDLDGALASYRRSLEVAEAVAKQAPECLEWCWDVTVSLDRVGDVLAAKGKTSEALASYRQGLEIAGELIARDPTRLEWQRDLAVSCHKTGLLEAECGREAEAREALEQGKAIIARLAEIARYQAQWRADLSRFDAALRGLGP